MMASLVNVVSILDDLLLVIRGGAEQVGPPNQILGGYRRYRRHRLR
jgi:hypothetical protein